MVTETLDCTLLDMVVLDELVAVKFIWKTYNNSIYDLQGRYVCCDNQGCDGFNADNLTPHCKNYGHVPFNFGLLAPTIGDQGKSQVDLVRNQFFELAICCDWP
jgi:hypothetical protein